MKHLTDTVEFVQSTLDSAQIRLGMDKTAIARSFTLSLGDAHVPLVSIIKNGFSPSLVTDEDAPPTVSDSPYSVDSRVAVLGNIRSEAKLYVTGTPGRWLVTLDRVASVTPMVGMNCTVGLDKVAYQDTLGVTRYLERRVQYSANSNPPRYPSLWNSIFAEWANRKIGSVNSWDSWALNSLDWMNPTPERYSSLYHTSPWMKDLYNDHIPLVRRVLKEELGVNLADFTVVKYPIDGFPPPAPGECYICLGLKAGSVTALRGPGLFSIPLQWRVDNDDPELLSNVNDYEPLRSLDDVQGDTPDWVAIERGAITVRDSTFLVPSGWHSVSFTTSSLPPTLDKNSSWTVQNLFGSLPVRTYIGHYRRMDLLFNDGRNAESIDAQLTKMGTQSDAALLFTFMADSLVLPSRRDFETTQLFKDSKKAKMDIYKEKVGDLTLGKLINKLEAERGKSTRATALVATLDEALGFDQLISDAVKSYDVAAITIRSAGPIEYATSFEVLSNNFAEQVAGMDVIYLKHKGAVVSSDIYAKALQLEEIPADLAEEAIADLIEADATARSNGGPYEMNPTSFVDYRGYPSVRSDLDGYVRQMITQWLMNKDMIPVARSMLFTH